MATASLLEALAVTAELTGTQLSTGAISVMVGDLSAYPEPQVMGALTRCRRELRGRLTVAEILARLDDGRPGAEEAWAMIPTIESQTIVWTDEMCEAHGIAQPLIERGDLVAGRMAFVESYRGLVIQARAEHKPVKWWASLGHDKAGRDGPIRKAYEAKRLTESQVRIFLPPPEAEQIIDGLPAPQQKRIEGPRNAEHISALLNFMKEASKS